MSLVETAPTAIHRGKSDLPMVDLGELGLLQLMQVDLATGVWVVHQRFEPGALIQKHKHTGPVYAFTVSGRWYYLESPQQVNTEGSYLHEPAGSVHTLCVPDDVDGPTDVWFTIFGANLNLDEQDNVEMVVDAAFIYDFYKAMCSEQFGVADPPVIVIE